MRCERKRKRARRRRRRRGDTVRRHVSLPSHHMQSSQGDNTEVRPHLVAIQLMLLLGCVPQLRWPVAFD
jgi:hypothetical protein